MSTFVLLIVLAIVPSLGQTSVKTTVIDLSGSWRDKEGWIWTVSQNGAQITILSTDGTTTHVGLDGRVIKYIGTLDGHSIRYTDWIVLGDDASSASCQSYMGQKFEFVAKLKISKDANRMEQKVHDKTVTKGQCRLSLKKMPHFILSRVSGK